MGPDLQGSKQVGPNEASNAAHRVDGCHAGCRRSALHWGCGHAKLLRCGAWGTRKLGALDPSGFRA